VAQDEVSPDQQVRANSSRSQTTNASYRSPSVRQMRATAALTQGGRTSPNRRLKYAELPPLQEYGKNHTDDLRLKGCGRRIRRGNVGEAAGLSATTIFCDRAWTCPVCGYHAARAQFWRLLNVLTAWTSRGGSVAILTSTVSHNIDDELHVLWDRLERGWNALAGGASWRSDRRTFGLRHYVRITEVVHNPDSGWHPHFHSFLLLDPTLSQEELCELEDHLTARFMRGVQAAGGCAKPKGQQLDLLQSRSELSTAGYYAKATTGRWTEDGSRTPIAILANSHETGEGNELWHGFSSTVAERKRRRYNASRGIASLSPTGHHRVVD